MWESTVSLSFRIAEQDMAHGQHTTQDVKQDTVACELDPHSSPLAQDQRRNFQSPWCLSWPLLKVGGKCYMMYAVVKNQTRQTVVNTHRFLGSAERTRPLQRPRLERRLFLCLHWASASGAPANGDIGPRLLGKVCWRLTCRSSSATHSSSLALCPVIVGVLSKRSFRSFNNVFQPQTLLAKLPLPHV